MARHNHRGGVESGRMPRLHTDSPCEVAVLPAPTTSPEGPCSRARGRTTSVPPLPWALSPVLARSGASDRLHLPLQSKFPLH